MQQGDTRRCFGGIERVSRRLEIRRIRAEGERSEGRFVRVWKLHGTRGTRVGFTTGRGFKSSVRRNRAKRRARGCIIEIRDLLSDGTTYLIECKPGSDSADYQELVNDIKKQIYRG